MPQVNIVQSFNSGTRYNSINIDADATAITAISALLPKGATGYSPDATEPQGTARAIPTHYVNVLVTCKDTSDREATPSFIGVKYGKPTLSTMDIKNAVVGVVKLPGGQICDKISTKNYDVIGSAEPVA